MAADESSDDLAKLVDCLDEAVSLLERYGEAHWANWLSVSRRELLAHDGHGLFRLLRAHGGMGSFNDLLLAEHLANERLSTLRSEAWRLAHDLQRDVDDLGG